MDRVPSRDDLSQQRTDSERGRNGEAERSSRQPWVIYDEVADIPDGVFPPRPPWWRRALAALRRMT